MDCPARYDFQLEQELLSETRVPLRIFPNLHNEPREIETVVRPSGRVRLIEFGVWPRALPGLYLRMQETLPSVLRAQASSLYSCRMEHEYRIFVALRVATIAMPFWLPYDFVASHSGALFHI